MLKIIIISLFLAILVSASVSAIGEQCGLYNNPPPVITIKLSALDNQNPNLESKYQYPNFREEDMLSISFIKVENPSNCTLNATYLKISIDTPNNSTVNDPFCRGFFQIPPIAPNETYYFYHKNTTLMTYDSVSFFRYNYADSNSKEDFFCVYPLNYVGIWKITPSLTPPDYSSSPNMASWSILSNDNKLYLGEFKVRSKSELASLDLQQKSLLWSTIVVILIGIVTIIAQILSVIWQMRKTRQFELDQQIELIDSLTTQTELIKGNTLGQIEELSKSTPTIPSYFISNIDSKYYLTRLWSKINKHETKSLKDLLLKLDQKVSNTNRMIEILQNSLLYGPERVTNQILREVKSGEYKYHKDALELINKINNEISKIKRISKERKCLIPK